MLLKENMMYEQQQQQQQQQMSKKGDGDRRRSMEEKRLEIVDLSGMSLDSLPNPSLNLSIICKLDLSNNNLQVSIYLSSFHLYSLPSRPAYSSLISFNTISLALIFFSSRKTQKGGEKVTEEIMIIINRITFFL